MNRQVVLKEVNAHLICVLCGGYFIDATTIVECIHSFCRSCIVKHLENSLYCPICEVMVDKSRPLNNLRPDPLLQNIVNKVVPDLLQTEVKRKAKYYEDNPDSKEVDELIYVHRMWYNNADAIYVSICNCQEPNKKWELRCSSSMPLKHLKKLVIGKFGLDPKRVVVEFLLEYQRLREDLTLLQISYLDSNSPSTDKCLNLMYSILKVEKTSKPDLNHVDNSIAESRPAGDKEIQLAITEGGVMSLSVSCAESLDEVIATSNGSCFSELTTCSNDQSTCTVNQTTCSNDQSTCTVNQTTCSSIQPTSSNDKSICAAEKPSVSSKALLDSSPEPMQIVEFHVPTPSTQPTIPVLDKSISKSIPDNPIPIPVLENPKSSPAPVISLSTPVSTKPIPSHVPDKTISASVSNKHIPTAVPDKLKPTSVPNKPISIPSSPLAKPVSTSFLSETIPTTVSNKPSSSLVSNKPASTTVSNKPLSCPVSNKAASSSTLSDTASTPVSDKAPSIPVSNKPASTPVSDKPASTPASETSIAKPASASSDTVPISVTDNPDLLSSKKNKLKGVNGVQNLVEVKKLKLELPRVNVKDYSNVPSKSPTSPTELWSPKQQRLRPRLMTKTDVSKSAKIRRTMPRFLGNPSSGVKPMYNNDDVPEKSSSSSIHQSILRVDPKTLRPFVKPTNEPISSSSNTPLVTSPFVPRNKPIILPDPMLTPYNPMSLPPGLHSSLPPTVSLPYRNQKHNSREDSSKT